MSSSSNIHLHHSMCSTPRVSTPWGRLRDDYGIPLEALLDQADAADALALREDLVTERPLRHGRPLVVLPLPCDVSRCRLRMN